MDVNGRFLAIFCSRYTYLELSTTLGAHPGMGYRPGMASASAIGRPRGAQWPICEGGGRLQHERQTFASPIATKHVNLRHIWATWLLGGGCDAISL